MKGMAWSTTSKGSPIMSSNRKSISWIAVSVGVLAVFLIYASWGLVSYPLGSAVHSHFYGVDSTANIGVSESSKNEDSKDAQPSSDLDSPTVSSDQSSDSRIEQTDTNSNSQEGSSEPTSEQSQVNKEGNEIEARDRAGSDSQESSTSFDGSKDAANSGLPSKYDSQVDLVSTATLPVAGNDTSDVTSSDKNEEPASVDLTNQSGASSADTANPECDLYHGNWIHDPSGPLYRNDTCPVITQMQNCQANGRPDKDYENWRWKPSQCDLPRFDPKKFLELMRGKTLAFIGDSVARNQMESLLCILWQVEVPKNRGNRNMQRYYFRSASVMIARMWSSWLVKHYPEPFGYAEAGVDKLHLDAPDDKLMEFLPMFDVVVLSSGHWFAKKSVYILNNEIVGGQLWSPPKEYQKKMKINSIQAYGISVETILTSILAHPNYTGLTIVRSYSPDHYEGGAWNTGGSCTGKEKPLGPGELVENEFTNVMHEQQINGFKRTIEKVTNASRLKLMDITEVFQYRHDGHPGPYRSTDPNKITKRGPDGRPPPQDCLHWCMPGPVDTWNELVLEIIRREYEGSSAS
ncbi:Protein yls7 [Stylosanthes scabra]|uniref:Protein yls7 n=1 Tax=Stylosanthes scabra TaxID=79078 RepID=A0ABU6T634_9FABA|nr:Protein yls7 [Stylosanthes scabra]